MERVVSSAIPFLVRVVPTAVLLSAVLLLLLPWVSWSVPVVRELVILSARSLVLERLVRVRYLRKILSSVRVILCTGSITRVRARDIWGKSAVC
jgi:hypothetical protein